MFQSIYVHFPFCEAKCHYCDFYSLGREKTKTGDPDLFEQALRVESELSTDFLAPTLETLFFGGGTPSMTTYDSMARALEPLALQSRLTPQTEWTLEANPSSVDLESLKAYRRFGINRISMGVQSLQPELLTKLGRVHTRNTALKSLETLFKAGFEQVSVDLLCGVPGQSYADIEESLTLLTQFPITHLSCYLLTLAKNHKLARDLPDEDTQLSHLLFVHNWMEKRGFEHYEISNYSLPGKRARHNLRYWQHESYLGLGPSAHSYDSVKQQRWKNSSSLHRYADQLLTRRERPIEWTENLTPEQLKLEEWMLSLRLAEGFPLEWLNTSQRQHQARTFEIQGLLEPHPQQTGRLRLTPKGFALSDQVIAGLA